MCPELAFSNNYPSSVYVLKIAKDKSLPYSDLHSSDHSGKSWGLFFSAFCYTDCLFLKCYPSFQLHKSGLFMTFFLMHLYSGP